MIEINLSPLELREKKSVVPFERIFKTRLIFIVLGSLVLLHLFLHSITAIGMIRLNKLGKSWQGLSPKKVQVDQIKNELAGINKEIPLIEQLIAKRVVWSKKLNRINDLMISGIWLKELTFEKQKTRTKAKTEYPESLVIRGSAASRTKDEPALIGRFMQNLKDDPSFSSDFTEIELGPIKKRLIKQTEVMDFVLICQFKPEKLEALLK